MATILQKLEALKADLPDLQFEKNEVQLWDEDKYVYYRVSGLKGNNALSLHISDEQGVGRLASLTKVEIFQDFLAITSDGRIEVLLDFVSPKTRRFSRNEDEDEAKTVLAFGLNYFKNELSLTIEVGHSTRPIMELASLISSLRLRHSRQPKILVIENLTKPTAAGLESDVRNIVNSALFDIEFTYDIALETIPIESLSRSGMIKRRKVADIPVEKFDLIYKKYIPELIQYFHIADKVDFAPFKFICYYHIVEYFADKSAYRLISAEIQRLLKKPDFHEKIETYVNSAIGLFRKETEKNLGDKLKIERVLKQFVDREELKQTLSDLNVLDIFSKDVTLDCAKPLKLPAINFHQDGNFYGELTKRFYSLRCSIVHSNPDFDENKGVPFVPTPSNIFKLRQEMALITEIARKIIVDSAK